MLNPPATRLDIGNFTSFSISAILCASLLATDEKICHNLSLIFDILKLYYRINLIIILGLHLCTNYSFLSSYSVLR